MINYDSLSRSYLASNRSRIAVGQRPHVYAAAKIFNNLPRELKKLPAKCKNKRKLVQRWLMQHEHFYPDPEPVSYCITDVSPSYLTDGVFFNGRIGPTHKCVAKQLSAVPRGPNDPVAPRAQVSPRTLERWCVHGKGMHVDNCGRNAKAIHGMMGLLPKEEVDPYAGWRSKVALFPRSEQYEYSYIRDARIRALKNDGDEGVAEVDSRKCLGQSAMTLAFEYTDPPVWWKDRVPMRVQCAVGHPDDYRYHRPDYGNDPGEDGMEEDSDRVKGKVGTGDGGQGHAPTDLRTCECSQYTHKSSTCNTEGVADEVNKKKCEVNPVEEHDPRWLQVGLNVPRNNEERKKLLSNIKKPYLHEMNTWYSENKPTKLIPSLISEGKRPILEWRFSNL